MIRVNLLPHHLRPVRRSSIPYLLSGGLFLIALVAMAFMWVKKEREINERERAIAGYQEELDALEPIRRESDELEQLKLALADKIGTIAEITSDRIIWSRQLWSLARLAPPNFWYDGISVETKQYRERQPTYNAQTKKTEMKTVTVTKPILKVEGYVTEAEDGTMDVNPLLIATTMDEEFSELFQLEPPSLKDDEFDGYEVKSFTLEYLILAGKTTP